MTTIARFATAVAVAGVAFAAVPALATPKLPTSPYKARYDAKTQRFCLNPAGADAVSTGTHIQLVECRTQGAWAARGLTVTLK